MTLFDALLIFGALFTAYNVGHMVADFKSLKHLKELRRRL